MAILKPPESITVGLAEAAAIYVIYGSALPNHADIRSAPAHNTDIEAARKKAAWTSAAVLGFVYLLTRDLNSFLLGGLALGGIDFLTKHANGVNPQTGKLATASGGSIASAPADPGDNSTAYPMPDYSDSADTAYAG
jgi:hypothetical protein